MHGDLVQSVRTQTLKDFKDGKIDLLVCSDVAARGLDVDAVSHVFNYDVPFSPDDYIHRIGRTGRAGATGRSWTIADENDDKFVKNIEKLISRAIPVVQLADFERGTAGEGDAAEPARPPRERTPRERSGRERAPRERIRRTAPPEITVIEESKPVAARPPAIRAQVRRNDRPRHDDGPDSFGDDVPAFLRR